MFHPERVLETSSTRVAWHRNVDIYVYHSERAVNHLDHFSVESRGQCSDTNKEDAKFKCCSVASNVLHNTTTSCLVLLFIILSSSETPGAYDKRAFERLGLKTDESWCNQDHTKWNTAPNPFLRLQMQSNTLTSHLAAKLYVMKSSHPYRRDQHVGFLTTY